MNPICFCFICACWFLIYAEAQCGSVGTIANSTQCPYPKDIYKNEKTGILYAACQSGIVSIHGSIANTIANATQCPSASRVVVDSATGIIYAACNGGGVISIVGSSVSTLASSAQCSGPRGVYKYPNGPLYVACSNSGVIAITNSAVTTVVNATECPNAYSVDADTLTGIIYIACRGSGSSLLSINGGSITAITQCPTPLDVFVDSVGMVYATCGSGVGVVSVQGATVTTLANVSVCPSPFNVYADRLNGVLHATCSTSSGSRGGVISIAGSTATTIATSTQCPFAATLSKDVTNGLLYVACNTGNVIAINTCPVCQADTNCAAPKPWCGYNFVVTQDPEQLAPNITYNGPNSYCQSYLPSYSECSYPLHGNLQCQYACVDDFCTAAPSINGATPLFRFHPSIFLFILSLLSLLK